MGDKVVEEITLSSDDEDAVQVKPAPLKQLDKKPRIIHLLPTASHPVITPRRIELNGSSLSGTKNVFRAGPKSKTRPVDVVQKKPEVLDEVILLDSDEDDEPKPDQKTTPLPSVNFGRLTGTQNGNIKVELVVPNPLASSSQPGPSSSASSSMANGHSNSGNTGTYLPIGAHDFRSDAANEIKALLKRSRSRLSRSDYNRLEEKFWKKYHKLNAEPLYLHAKLQLKIAQTSTEMDKLPEGTFSWKLISDLWLYFNADKLRNDEDSENEEKEDIAEKKRKEIRDKTIIKLEKTIRETSRKIKKLDEKEVDFVDYDLDNDHNSPYLIRERLIAKLVKVWNQLCNITRCSKQTGRPVQKKLIVKNITIYEEFDEKVQTFVNSQGHLFAPDFTNILNIVKKENVSASLHLDDTTLRRQAEILHQYVVNAIQQRRLKDQSLAFPAICDDPEEDPANTDAELEAKLEENRKNARTIKQVVDEFAEKQMAQKLEPEEVNDENADSSPPPSDNEEDDEEDEEEDDSEDTDTSSVANSCIDQTLLDPEDKPADQEALFEDEEEGEDEDSEVEILDDDVEGEVEEASDVATLVDEDQSTDIERKVILQQSPEEVVEEACVENKPNDSNVKDEAENPDGPPSKKIKLTPAPDNNALLVDTSDQKEPPVNISVLSVPDEPTEEINGVVDSAVLSEEP